MNSPCGTRLQGCSYLHDRFRGSALVESILLVSVMSFFMVGIPLIGKLIDLQQTAVQASRYGVWEKTIAKNPMSNAAFSQQRFFREDAAPISTAPTAPRSHYLWGSQDHDGVGEARDAKSLSTTVGNSVGNTLVPHLYGSSNQLVVLDSGVSGGSAEVEQPAKGNVSLSVGNAVRNSARLIGGAGWDLPANGLMGASVSVNIEQNAMFDTSATGCAGAGPTTFGCVQESSSILVDGWSAGDDESAKRRIKSFVPTSRIERVGDVVAQLGKIPLLKELKGLKNAFGCVQTDVLPGKTTNDAVVLSRYQSSGCRAR